MLIKGTDKIKGVLDLPLCKFQLVANEERFISNDDYYKSDIQMAINLGMLIKKDDVCSNNSEKLVRCKNVYHRPFSIPGYSDEIVVGQVFSVKESDLQHDAIRKAIAAKMIEVLDVSGGPKVLEEVSININNPELEEIQKPVEEEGNVKISKKIGRAHV